MLAVDLMSVSRNRMRPNFSLRGPDYRHEDPLTNKRHTRWLPQ